MWVNSVLFLTWFLFSYQYGWIQFCLRPLYSFRHEFFSLFNAASYTHWNTIWTIIKAITDRIDPGREKYGATGQPANHQLSTFHFGKQVISFFFRIKSFISFILVTFKGYNSVREIFFLSPNVLIFISAAILYKGQVTRGYIEL